MSVIVSAKVEIELAFWFGANLGERLTETDFVEKNHGLDAFSQFFGLIVDDFIRVGDVVFFQLGVLVKAKLHKKVGRKTGDHSSRVDNDILAFLSHSNREN